MKGQTSEKNHVFHKHGPEVTHHTHKKFLNSETFVTLITLYTRCVYIM